MIFKKIFLITGASGYIGSRLTQYLSTEKSIEIFAHYRSPTAKKVDGASKHFYGDLESNNFDSSWFEGVDTLIHTAARVHMLSDKSADPLSKFREVNVISTLNLANRAVQSGVKRFIFLSSIGVNGLTTGHSEFFTEKSTPNPHSPYAVSKLEAENGLLKIARETGLEVVLIRPPLVYGANAPGNFGRLMRILEMGTPLPFRGIKNRRSFIFIDNLLDFIFICAIHPRAVNELFLVSDGFDISTTQLMEGLACGANLPLRLFYFPYSFLKIMGTMFGFGNEVAGLCENLRIDISKAREYLNWTPPFSVAESLHIAGKNT